jgi:hypothetical protein
VFSSGGSLSCDPQIWSTLDHRLSVTTLVPSTDHSATGPAPVASIRLLDRLGLYQSVFALPLEQLKQVAYATDGSSSPWMRYGGACVDCMEAASGLATALGLVMDQEEKRFLHVAALMLPLRGMQVHCKTGGVGGTCDNKAVRSEPCGDLG